MTYKTYYYQADVWAGDTLEIDDAFEFQTERDIEAYDGSGYDEFELRWLVEEMADDYVSNHDGYESYQYKPVCTFAVWNSDRKFAGAFDVQVEYEPSFIAWRSKDSFEVE